MSSSLSASSSQPRRSFIRNLARISAVAMLPLSGFRRSAEFRLGASDDPDENYWSLVKQQFAIPKGRIMANSANLCPSPRFVNDRVRHFQEDLAGDVSFQNRAKFSELRAGTLKALAEFVGASANEIGITRNTSESNNIVVNGLDLKKGDEVIIWEQNHPTNNLAWKVRSKRMGFTVKEISVPPNPMSNNDLIIPFEGAITSRTRVISFSHLSNSSGILLPAKEICKLANERNILTLVDGAQVFGALVLDLHELGCDFYAASTHKWLMGPMENGILYVREQRIPELWPDSIAPGWSVEKTSVDEKYCALGQRNNPTIAAIPEILEFHNQIGRENIERRIRSLHTHLKSQIRDQIPNVEFISPLEESLSGGVTIFNMPGKDYREIFGKLYEDHGVASAPMNGIRYSPTIMNTMDDMDVLATSAKEAAA